MMQMIDISRLKVSDANPRFRIEDLQTLADSIKRHGVIEPLVVRPNVGNFEGKFTILAGHRRAEAATLAKIAQVPCIIREHNDHDAVMHLVENIQRQDLRPMEIAAAIAILIEDGTKQKVIQRELGKSAAWVSKFATIGKAITKLEEKNEGSSAYMIEYSDSEKLYQKARSILGLDKMDLQDALNLESDTQEMQKVSSSDTDEVSSEIAFISELKAAAEKSHAGMMAGVRIDVKPKGKKGWCVSFSFKDERTASEAFRK